jgi:glucose/arabinose dehydrogenase
MRRLLSAAALLSVALLLVACGGGGGDDKPASATTTNDFPPPPTATTDEQSLARNPGGPKVTTVATGLEVPWEIGFLPDGRALITERPGRVRLLLPDGKLSPKSVAEVDVVADGEGGLLGLAVDPDFERNSFIYLYRTTERGNEVARYRLDGTRLREQATIVQDIPAGPIHDGGRIRFGPDRKLYISTGEAGDGSRAQDENSLGGKFLTLTPDAYRGDGGEPQIFSTGHRNAQGFDWQPKTGLLLSTEHGPSGGDGPHGFDELNVVRKGGNYGWPEVYGKDHGAFIAPVAVYDQAIAPSGGSFVTKPGSAWTGDFIFGALIGEQMRRIRLKDGRVVLNERLFPGKYGRIRDVVEGPDGALYALTSNRDGRGSVRSGDDKLLRIVPPSG